MALGQQILGHGTAHVAQSNETDLSHPQSLPMIL
jgi:hypothetical protein